jgi:hypothetical protein
MAKKLTVDLPDNCEKAVLVAVMWVNQRGEPFIHIDHRELRIPFEVAREALMTGVAAVELDDHRLRATPRPVRDAARGLQYADTDETRKKPS